MLSGVSSKLHHRLSSHYSVGIVVPMEEVEAQDRHSLFNCFPYEFVPRALKV